MKWSPTRPAVVRGHMARLGIGAVRVTLRWSPGETSPRGSTMVALRRAQDTARGRRLVLAVYSKARKAPQIARRRQEYCSYVASLLALAPRVNDVVIWNEPNSNRFWQPQFASDGSSASAPAYELLLAECWDVLHAVRPGVNVIAASAPRGNDDPAADHPSQSPVAFYTALAAAYRASGRDRPIFDTVGHNPYPNTSAEPPWVRHQGGTIGEGDYGKLVSVLRTGFGGTAQPVPGTGLTIWYMEDGFQTTSTPLSAATTPAVRATSGRSTRSRTRAARPPPADGQTTRRPSSPTPSGSPIASRTSARSSTSCSRTSVDSADGSQACSG